MFDKNTSVTVYSDDAQLNGSVKTQKAGKAVKVTIPCNGGIVIVG
jgi:hypothetical protein